MFDSIRDKLRNTLCCGGGAVVSFHISSCFECALLMFQDARKKKKEEHKRWRTLAQSRRWQVSANVLQAFKEAVSNWLDLDLFVVKGRLK